MGRFMIKTIVLVLILIFTPKISNAHEADTTELHVFIEVFATNPALTQMIELTKLPRHTRKIIAWHRFPQERNLELLAKHNARVIPLPQIEYQHHDMVMAVLNTTLEELSLNPNARLHLHVNMTKMEVVIRPFLEHISKERIAKIHLYEDGYGGMFKELAMPPKYLPKSYRQYTPQELEEAIFIHYRKWEQEMALYLHKIYPVTYYILGWKDVQENLLYEPLRIALNGAHVVNIDFDELSLTMNEWDKQFIYRLTNFDEMYFRNIMNNKKTLMFVMGYYGNIDIFYKAEQNAIKQIKNGAFSPVNTSDYILLYKQHPTYWSAGYTESTRLLFSDMIEVPAQVPFEVFILAGLKPTYTAGRESSLFYALHDEDILFIIKRNSFDTLFPYLSDIRHVRYDKFMNIKEFIK